MGDVKHPESRALVAKVMKALEVTTARELAAALGMTKLDDERRVRAWVTGDSAPNFYGTVALLDRAGFLQSDAAPRPAPADDGETLRQLRALDRKLDTEIIPRLERLADAGRQAERERTS